MAPSWWRRAKTLLVRLYREDSGQDLLEYVLLTGIIAIAGILVFPIVQGKMAAAYQSWNTSAQAVWEPPPPL